MALFRGCCGIWWFFIHSKQLLSRVTGWLEWDLFASVALCPTQVYFKMYIFNDRFCWGKVNTSNSTSTSQKHCPMTRKCLLVLPEKSQRLESPLPGVSKERECRLKKVMKEVPGLFLSHKADHVWPPLNHEPLPFRGSIYWGLQRLVLQHHLLGYLKQGLLNILENTRY